VSARDDMSSHVSIFVMNADGTNVRRITPDSTFGYIHGLAWSPDGKQIAFGASVELPSAQFDLYIINSTGALLRQLTNTETVDEAEPAFKPYGDRIAFRSAPVSGGPGEIWTIGSDGAIPQPLISCPAGCFGPAWSPDGWSVAYSTGSSQSSSAEVQVINIVGAGGTPTTVAVDARYPSFSPDGIKLVYRKLVDGAYQVGTSAADGTSPTVLTAFTAGALPTSWGR
jgi:Tol biopolymer transport system component